MSRLPLPRWIVQAAAGIALVCGLTLALGAAASPGAFSGPQVQATGVSPNGGCEPGFSGSPETKCEDVNECAIGNGGCSRLSGCENTPGSRTCGGCPKDYRGDGYVGCFDVNDCANPDCSDRLPSGADVAQPPPAVTTSGDVTVAATSAKGAAATFTATAKDTVDGSRSVNCMPVSGSVFKVGKTTVTCWAFNKRGRIGRSTLTVTVTQ
jgi:HYR domain-containing protein